MEGLQDTIIALATPPGVGAIGVIRLSGKDVISIVDEVFHGKRLTEQSPNTIHFGTIRDGSVILDEVLVSLFKAPRSFTKEDVVEISCHGSQYIIRQVIKLFVRMGVRLAKPGEFTKRAFLNGQFDLAQAEAVADLIASDSESAHRTAMSQMRGGFSEKLKTLRERLIHFASMIELELDFSEEDVEFASREDLKNLILELQRTILQLIDSFE
ncbi:MAG: tRNA uridine-5-carboxymethylaminomethyl(34) synthesis GTPase MnmE, partial [Bacteroidota bacterium]